ncbi:hypothetical protein PG985_004913 [Apiospora marii]|uniref:uncharacterized protein n=1 Tax=Apiospora marii TaxID=335849 RepID=UPI00313070B3
MSQPQSSDLESQAKALPPIGREARYWELVEDILERAKEIHHEPEAAESRQACMTVECAGDIVELLQLPYAPRTEQIEEYFQSLVGDEAKELYFFMCKVVDALGFFIELQHKAYGKDSEKHAAFMHTICEYLQPLLQLQVEGAAVELGTPARSHSEDTVKAEPSPN